MLTKLKVLSNRYAIIIFYGKILQINFEKKNLFLYLQCNQLA